MLESTEHAPGRLPGEPRVAEGTVSSRGVRLPAAEQKRTGLILVGLLVLLHGWSVRIFEPAFSEQSGAFLIQVLMLLGAVIAFLGLWDCLGLLSLRYLLRRDRGALWRNYGRPRDLQRRLDNSTFELDSELGGGVVAAVLHRFISLGKPRSNFVSHHLAAMIGSSRIGTGSLGYGAVAAPILGALGVAVGLRASLSVGSTNLSSQVGWASVVLGLSISLLALLFSRLLGASLAQDCASLLAPVVEAARGLTGTKKIRTTEVSGDEAAFDAWTNPPWSGELRRLRSAAAVVSWVLVVALIVFVSLPGGIVDQWLG